ncbi:MAG TPA: hypothetical protein ENN51_09110 [candidate division WOR-3 bacterium]|uniref:ThiD2 domain-containing protein n=1 Tax=candidate division WOR-3 bacterium TaxID=2052148 RepID=A0A7V0T762_UNCW3|nr:hypothetical protein [candidate division WOR-3 bacterium]
MDSRTARIVDVNLNRLTEGLKVVEDVVRFGPDSPPGRLPAQRGLLRSIRALRTKVGADVRVLRRQVIARRASETDPGRADRFDRTKRRSLDDVLAANFKRCEESCRVLEELLKIDEPRLAVKFKAARFRLYDLERRALAAPRP